MKSITIAVLFFLSNMSFSQTPELVEYHHDKDLSYILGNIYWDSVYSKVLSGSRVTILKQSDPKNTPKDLFEGYGGVLSNLIISVRNTGEFAYSKLYFIRGLIKPIIKKVGEVSDFEKIKIVIQFQDRKFSKKTQTFLIPALR